MPAERIWYEGAWRDARDAVARIEVDAEAFLARAVDAFERDESHWFVLAESGGPRGTVGVEVADGRVWLRPFEDAPAHLWPDFLRLRDGQWRVDVERSERAIAIPIAALHTEARRLLEDAVRAARDAAAADARRGVASLESIVPASPLPRARRAMDEALRALDDVAAAKLERLRALRP